MNEEERRRRLASFEQATDLPMLVLSLLLFPVLLIPLAVDLSEAAAVLFRAAGIAIWAAFAVDLAVKVYLAPRRGRYLLSHWYDVVIVAVPLLRPFRLLLFLALTRRSAAAAHAVLTRHGLQYVLLVAAVLVVTAAAAVTYFERNAGGAITGFGTGLWWAMQTVTSVGYGDAVPVTVPGRVTAGLVMLVGIALFTVVTANVAAFLVESGSRGASARTLDDVVREIRALEARVAALQDELRRGGAAREDEAEPAAAATEPTQPEGPADHES